MGGNEGGGKDPEMKDPSLRYPGSEKCIICCITRTSVVVFILSSCFLSCSLRFSSSSACNIIHPCI